MHAKEIKEILAEFLFSLNEASRFQCGSTFWSVPVIGFSHDKSLPRKFIKELQKSGMITEGVDSIICILGDWESVTEGIIFTDRAMYVNSPKNEDKKFKIRYDEVLNLTYFPDEPRLCIETEKGRFRVTTKLWSKLNIHDFLQFACGKYEFSEKIEKKFHIFNCKKLRGCLLALLLQG